MLKKIVNFFGKCLPAAAAALVAGSAHAESFIDLSGVSVDASPVGTLAAVILTACGSIWVVRKLVKLVNHS